MGTVADGDGSPFRDARGAFQRVVGNIESRENVAARTAGIALRCDAGTLDDVAGTVHINVPGGAHSAEIQRN